ncbi:MAG: hypothetical protein LBC88_08645 [Spirochaetaceae bacterium]|jgi:hypothetical protein|nr:hypothetical protein [Spirochaetaceae bacterium]
MKKRVFVLGFCLTGFSLFAQTTQLAPGAQGQLAALLNKSAMVKPAAAAPLGKNWFRLETDAHVFTDEVSVAQVAAVLLDREHQDTIYNGKKSRLTAKVVSVDADGAIMDFVSVSVGPLNIQIKTPYRARVQTAAHTDTKIALEVRQLPADSASNDDIKNLFATRYAESVAINGKIYTYIRIYTIDEINASILPGAKNTLEKSSAPVNEETLRLIIAAAKTR